MCSLKKKGLNLHNSVVACSQAQIDYNRAPVAVVDVEVVACSQAQIDYNALKVDHGIALVVD